MRVTDRKLNFQMAIHRNLRTLKHLYFALTLAITYTQMVVFELFVHPMTYIAVYSPAIGMIAVVGTRSRHRHTQ